MPLTYSRRVSSSFNTHLRWARTAVCTALLLLTSGCLSTIPQYVRGDVAARSTALIPRGATYRILRSHTATPPERALTALLGDLLQGFGLKPETTDNGADIWVGISHTVSGEVTAGSPFWREPAALFETPSSRQHRFAVQVSKPNTRDLPGQVLWRGEILSNGAARDAATLGDPFLRIVLSRFGREQTPTSFSFRVDDAAASQRRGRAVASHQQAAQTRPAQAATHEPRAEAAPELELPGGAAPDPEKSVEAAVVAATTPVVALLAAEPVVEASSAAALEGAPIEVPAAPEAKAAPPLESLPAADPAPRIEAPVEPEVAPRTEPAREPAANSTLMPPPAAAGAKVGREPETLFDVLFGTPPRPRPAQTARREVPKPTAPAEPAPPAPRAEPSPHLTEPAPPPAQSMTVAQAEPRAVPSSDQPPARPRRAAPVPATNVLPAAPEFADVGPTWRDAVGLCTQLSERGDVTCSIYVEVANSSPHLELQYVSSHSAQANWQTDARTVGGPFCVTSARHGLYGSARVVVRAEGALAERSCKELPR